MTSPTGSLSVDISNSESAMDFIREVFNISLSIRALERLRLFAEDISLSFSPMIYAVFTMRALAIETSALSFVFESSNARALEAIFALWHNLRMLNFFII